MTPLSEEGRKAISRAAKKMWKKKKLNHGTKRKVREVNQKSNGDPRFELFLKALNEEFPKDVLAPGVVLAWLPDKGCFYASIVRYRGFNGADRYVLTSVKASSLLASLELLMETYKNRLERLSALDEFLKSMKKP